ncbi:MAG: hypothetical protein AAB864_02115, partial [Patescibacteria group bacterium]
MRKNNHIPPIRVSFELLDWSAFTRARQALIALRSEVVYLAHSAITTGKDDLYAAIFDAFFSFGGIFEDVRSLFTKTDLTKESQDSLYKPVQETLYRPAPKTSPIIRETVIVGATPSPLNVTARLAVLEDFVRQSQLDFGVINERLRNIPTMLVLPTGSAGIRQADTVTNTATVNADTVTTKTLTLNGSGTVTGGLTINTAISAVQYTGGGLTDCNSEEATLNWDATTGTFSCGEDGGGGGTTLQTREGYSGDFNTTASLSFNSSHFVLGSNGTHASVSLDWGTGGPASLSQDETVTGFWIFDNNASTTGNFEVTGAASSSKFFGAGLTDCDGTVGNKTLLWDSTSGTFSCADDDVGSAGALIDIGEGTPDGTKVSSISFAAPHFNITYPAGALVKLDWTNGPASRSATQSIGGNWTFNAASTQFNVLEFTSASASGNIVTRGIFNSTNVGSNSFSGSLNTLLSLTSGKTVTANGINSLTAVSNSFAGSLNTALGLHATTDVSAGARFLGIGTGSNSF